MKCKYMKCGHSRTKHILHKSFDINVWNVQCIMCPSYKEDHGFRIKPYPLKRRKTYTQSEEK